MKTPERILLQLTTLGPHSAKMLAECLGITPMGIRQHLQSLEEHELVCYEEARNKVGRPTRFWSLTSQGYAQFAAQRTDWLNVNHPLFATEGLNERIRTREEKLFQHYASELAEEQSHQDKLTRLVCLRKHDGFMTELVEHPHGALLVENHCPIGITADTCSSLCDSELQLFHRLLGKGYQIERTAHAIYGSRHCAYLIRLREH